MIELSPDVYAWLSSIDIFENPNFETDQTTLQINEKGNVVLDSQGQKRIKTGSIFPRLFEKLNVLLNDLYGNIYKEDERLLKIIEEDIPQIKLKNFDIVLDVARNYYGIITDGNYKTLLIASDNETFSDFFQRLYSFYIEIEDKISKNKNQVNEETKTSIRASFSLDHKALPRMRVQEDFVDLDHLDSTNASEIPLTKTRSVLEFIIIALSRSLKMTAKQSAALLTDNKKYLSHVLIKGLSKNFNPIKKFYQEILSQINHFLELIEINSIAHPNQISKNIEMSLSTLKPGLLSKNLDVVFISGRVLTKLGFEFIERNLISSAWDWFVMPGGGLESTIMCLQKRNSAVEVVVSLLTNFGKYHMYELFALYLKSYLENEASYLDFMTDVMEKLSQLKLFVDEFIKNKIKQFLLDFAINASNSYNVNVKVNCCAFLSELWVNFSMYFEDDEENFRILNTIKKLSRDESRVVKYSSIAQMFRILTIFAKERNSFAPAIFKTLTFYLIEYHSEIYIKEFMLNNFAKVFRTIMSIPVGILVEPYIKQISVSLGTSYFFNMIDIEFLITLTKHPRLNIKDSILILDVLCKVYFQLDSGIYFYSITKSVFTMILSRYLINEIGVEFCFKYSKLLIETYCKIDKKLSEKIYLHAIKYNLSPEEKINKILPYFKNPSSKPLDMHELTKSVIVEMLLNIIEINNTFVNNVIKQLLVCANLRHFLIYGFHNIGLSKPLSFFGNINDTLHYYNINNEELDVDKDFENTISMIYDRCPESRLQMVNNSSIDRKFPHDKRALVEFLPKNILHNEKYNPPKYTQKLDTYFLDNNTKVDLGTLRNNYIILDLLQEEDRDVIELKKCLKDYSRFFKFTFNKYCGSVYHPIQGKLFDAVKEVTETIAPSEIIKMFKDHHVCVSSGYTNMKKIITREEILLILGIMNAKVFKRAKSKAGLNFDEFIEVFIQISFCCFNRAPFFYAKYTVAEYTKEMIKLFTTNVMNENLNNNVTELNAAIPEYLHPDELMTKAETELCESLNAQLSINDSVKIPKNLKKFLDTDIIHKYYVPDAMKIVMGDSYTICIELLDQVISNVTQSHVLESFCKVKEVYKVRPIVHTKLKLDREKEENRVLKIKKSNPETTTNSQIKIRPPIPKNKRYFESDTDNQMKKVIDNLEKRRIHNITESEGNVNTDDPRKGRSLNQKTSSKSSIVNHLQKRMIEEENIRKKEEKEKEKKRKLRSQIIKQDLEKKKDYKKSKEEMQMKARDEEKRKAEEKMQKRLQADLIKRQKIKSELETLKQIRNEEKAKREEEDNIRRKNRVSRKEMEVRNQRQSTKLDEDLRRIAEEKKLEKAKKRLENKFKNDQLEREREKFEKFFDQEKKQKEEKKSLSRHLESLINEENMRALYDKYSDHLNLLVELYSTSITKNIINKNSTVTTDGIHLNEFSNFATTST